MSLLFLPLHWWGDKVNYRISKLKKKGNKSLKLKKCIFLLRSSTRTKFRSCLLNKKLYFVPRLSDLIRCSHNY